MRAWWRRVPEAVKVAGLVLTLAGAVATATWSARGVWGEQGRLPERVGTLEATTRRHDQALDSLRRADREIVGRLERLICYAEAQARVRDIAECIR